MLPLYIEEATFDFIEEQMPSKDFSLEYEKDRINGVREGLEEVQQSIYFILNTERYQYIIYPWTYGVELVELIGEQREYAIPEVERRITEALIQDDRIESVDNFEFTWDKTKVSVSFTAHTVLGDVQAVKVVEL